MADSEGEKVQFAFWHLITLLCRGVFRTFLRGLFVKLVNG